jgi:glutamate formiminotransferase
LIGVKAMGVPLEHRGIVQVSMNLIDYHQTSMTQAFDAVEREALVNGISCWKAKSWAWCRPTRCRRIRSRG